MGKTHLNVSVSTYETEFDMQLRPSATGKNLFDAITATTGIRENWYFGLHFIDRDNQEDWLDMDKKILKQKVNTSDGGGSLKFQFKFRYFPENVADEVIQDVTLRLLFKQVRSDILSENIYCPAEKAVLMASYQVQAKFGDYDGVDKHTSGYLANEKLLPAKILSQHKLSIQEWEEKVSAFHKQHRGQNAEEAMLEYLKISQDLEMFGIDYYPVVNAKGNDALLGIDALGINFYSTEDKFNPKVSFPWSEIAKINATKSDFITKFVASKNTKSHKVKGKLPNSTKKMKACADGNNEMFKRRRMPEPLVVQQMKSEKTAAATLRKKQRDALMKEIEARERAESNRKEIEDRLKKMEEAFESSREELSKSKSEMEKMQEQLNENKNAREELEKQQNELKALLEENQNNASMEAEERAKLQEEIEARQREIEEMRESVTEREQQSKQLEEEMQEAKLRMERVEAEAQQNAAEAAREAAAAAAAMTNGNGVDSSSDNEDVPKIVVDQEFVDEDRDPDEKTEELLKDLRSDLTESQETGTETVDDVMYAQNLSEGRSKFKTLRDVRRGNTLRRIDLFENM